MSDNPTYIHGYSFTEQARLIEQAEILAPAVFGGLALASDRTLLEIGCGVGAETRHLLRRWPQLEIDAIDLSEEQLVAARDYLCQDIAEKRVRVTRMNAEDLRFADHRFDVAMTIWVLEHAPDPKKILREVSRVLRPGGRIILNEVNNDTFRFYPHNPVIQDWWDGFNAFQQSCGADPFIGRRLEGLVEEVGYTDIRGEPLYAVSSLREPQRRPELLRYSRDLMLSGAHNMKQAGYVDEALEQKLRAEFQRLESRTDVDFEYVAVRLTARSTHGESQPSH